MTEYKWISVDNDLLEFNTPVFCRNKSKKVGIFMRERHSNEMNDCDWLWSFPFDKHDLLNVWKFEPFNDCQIVEWADIILPSESNEP